MNADVAVCTVLVSRVRHVVTGRQGRDTGSAAAEIAGAVMAFQAKREHDWPAKQSRVRRTVRRMAHFTPLDTYRRVFERKRSAFVGMALQAGLLVSKRL